MEEHRPKKLLDQVRDAICNSIEAVGAVDKGQFCQEQHVCWCRIPNPKGLFDGLLATAGDDDGRSLGGKALGDSPTDASAGSRYDDVLIDKSFSYL